MISVPKHVKVIETEIAEKLKRLKKSDSELLEVQQLQRDEILEVSLKTALAIFSWMRPCLL